MNKKGSFSMIIVGVVLFIAASGVQPAGDIPILNSPFANIRSVQRHDIATMPMEVNLFIHGKNFGKLRDGGKVSFGKIILGRNQIFSWTDTRIDCALPPDANLEFGSHYRVMLLNSDGSPASNRHDFLLLIYLEGVQPASGIPGSTVNMWGYEFGSSPRGAIVRFANIPVTRIKWGNRCLKILVPRPLTSTFVNKSDIGKAWVERNGERISNLVNFTITFPRTTLPRKFRP